MNSICKLCNINSLPEDGAGKVLFGDARGNVRLEWSVSASIADFYPFVESYWKNKLKK